RTASPLVEGTVLLASGDHRGEGSELYGLDLLSEVEGKGFRIEADRERAIEALFDPEAVYLGRTLASDWNLHPESAINVTVGGRHAHLRVAGLIQGQDSRSSLWDRIAVMDIAAAQVLLSSVGRLDRIQLTTEPEHELDQVAKTVQAVLPPHLI